MRICQFRESRSCRVKLKIEDRSLNEMQKLVFDDCFWTTVNRTVVVLEASICYVTFNKLQNETSKNRSFEDSWRKYRGLEV